MSTDARCPTFVHDVTVATAVDFARGTIFISASSDDGEVKGRCRNCQTVLVYSLGDWADAPTMPMASRSTSRTETKETDT